MLAKLGRIVDRALSRTTPFTNVVGVARSLLALSSLSTLLLNRVDTLFRPVYSLGEAPFCFVPVERASLYCVAGPHHLTLAKWVAVAVLLVVASGWRPRVTAIAHWWVSQSYFLTAASADGGDQAAMVLTLLLLPVCLADPRRWHWDDPPASPRSSWATIAVIVAWAGLLLIQVQVAGIYFHAAIGKLFVYEWQDGTALYYWLQHPYFGLAPWLRPLVFPLLVNPYTVAALTWGVVALEVFLTMGLVATRPVKRVLLALGMALHLAIMIVHGLASFAMVMWAALILLLRPTDLPFAFPRRWSFATRRVVQRWAQRLKGGRPAPVAQAQP